MIRRRREEDHHSKTGHERWLVSYADFVTLLFGFFVVMYSVSQVSEQKYRVLSETLSNVFQGNTRQPVDREVTNDGNPLDQQGKISGLSPEINLVDTEVLARDLEDALIHLVQPGQVRISATEEWVQIDLNANVLFDSASADPKPEAREIFRQIAAKLAPFDNEIEVSGHTDDRPIRTPRFQSNWELSSARASSVVRLLVEDGVDPRQLSAVGYGEYRPVADNATDDGRAVNRRVVLMVARHPVRRQVVPLDGALDEALDKVPVADPPQAPVLTPPLAVPPVETPLPAEVTPEAPSESTVEPVRLRNGGLLFTRDLKKEPD
jgi:chemotaxis protein MotB